jgi:hypothetical protein
MSKTSPVNTMKILTQADFVHVTSHDEPRPVAPGPAEHGHQPSFRKDEPEFGAGADGAAAFAYSRLLGVEVKNHAARDKDFATACGNSTKTKYSAG